MKFAAVVPIVFAVSLVCLGAAAEGEGRFIDCRSARPDAEPAKRMVSAGEQGTRHTGFRVGPLPGDWVIPLAAQRPDRAFRGRASSTGRHSVLAEVRISPPAPAPLRMERVKAEMERGLKRQEKGRIRDFRSTLTEGTRNGVPTLEIRTECTDAGTNPPSKMITRGFVVVTADNRMLVVSVSERSADRDFRFDLEQAEAFFRAVRWEGGGQSP